MTINQKQFFAAIRPTLFEGRISRTQVEGLSAILDQWQTTATNRDLRHLAYMLATAHHETGRKMQPIRETGGTIYFRRMYDITGDRPRLAEANGNTTPGDGVRYSGRGFVQLTWKDNYARAGNRIGLDLVANPDLAMEMGPAIQILFAGMQEGWFTGKKLSDYFSATKEDWINARRIINGLDRAALIAGYAKLYHAALQKAAQTEPMMMTGTPIAVEQPKTAIPVSRRRRRTIRPSKALKPQPQPVLFHPMPMDPGR